MNDLEPNGEEKGIHWMPKWIMETADGKVGITRDDGCYLVLVREHGGKWSPTKWIPKEAAIFIANLAAPDHRYIELIAKARARMGDKEQGK